MPLERSAPGRRNACSGNESGPRRRAADGLRRRSICQPWCCGLPGCPEVGYAETCICSNSERVLQIPFIWDPLSGVRSIPVAGARDLVQINNVVTGRHRSNDALSLHGDIWSAACAAGLNVTDRARPEPGTP